MKTIKYDKEILNYIIPYMRDNEDLVYFLEIVGVRFLKLQRVIEYLLRSYNIRMAKGQFLDFAGMEVDADRDEADYDSFFCVNSPDINTEKKFYFLSSGLDPMHIISLADNEYLSKILSHLKGLKTINLTSNLLNKKITINDEFYNLEKELNLFKHNSNNQNKSIHFSTFLQIFVSSYLNLLYVLSIIGNYSQVIFYAEKFKTNKIINEYMKNNYKSKSIIFTINNYMMFSYIKLNQNEIKDNEIINDLYY